MHRSMARNLSLVSLLVLSLLTVTAAAQNSPIREADYSVKLYFVFGSEAAAQGRDLPSEISTIRSRIAADYGYRNIRLQDQHSAHVSSGGGFDLRGVTTLAGSPEQSDWHSFLEWVVRMDRETEAGIASLDQIRVGIRVPMRTPGTAPAVNFEGIGLTASRVKIATGRPAILGTVRVPGREGTLFIVMIVDEIEG